MEEVKQIPKDKQEEEKKEVLKKPKSPKLMEALELHISQFAITLYNMTKAYKSPKHLEAGSSTGIGLLLLSAMYWDPDKEGHLVVCTDPFPEKLERMAVKFKDSGFMTNKENTFFQCLEEMEQELDFLPEEKGVHIKSYLSAYTKFPFQDDQFNSFTSNLCPTDLKEVCRVLAPGGVAGFTFLAEKEKSTLITLAETAFKNQNLHFPDIEFAPGGVKDMVQYAKLAGFSKARGWLQTSVMIVENGDQLADILLASPTLKLQSVDEDVAHKAIAKVYDEEYAPSGKQVTLEAMILIAYK